MDDRLAFAGEHGNRAKLGINEWKRAYQSDRKAQGLDDGAAITSVFEGIDEREAGAVDNFGNYRLCRALEVYMRTRLVASIGLLALLGSMAYAPLACADTLDESALRKIPIGAATRFSDLSTFDAQAVCLLQPYQDRLYSKDAEAVRANRYLAANNFSSDEGRFALVLIGKEAIKIALFERSQKLDVLAKPEVSTAAETTLPQGFVPVECASGKSAAFAGVCLRDRTYVVLGELH